MNPSMLLCHTAIHAFAIHPRLGHTVNPRLKPPMLHHPPLIHSPTNATVTNADPENLSDRRQSILCNPPFDRAITC
jgi:hypothetical protein